MILRRANLHLLSRSSKLMVGKRSLLMQIKSKRITNQNNLQHNILKNRKLEHGFASLAMYNDYNIMKLVKKAS